jgi:hypothetical protein
VFVLSCCCRVRWDHPRHCQRLVYVGQGLFKTHTCGMHATILFCVCGSVQLMCTDVQGVYTSCTAVHSLLVLLASWVCMSAGPLVWPCAVMLVLTEHFDKWLFL